MVFKRFFFRIAEKNDDVTHNDTQNIFVCASIENYFEIFFHFIYSYLLQQAIGFFAL